ncbi:hypothetical protein FA95DRAFT_1565958 [Auriscalpium vulgare]|uniref:Uncharacterized protein n=1 Tax=Auriscalpium vulgare TaxID=40419 RepID=A0ACB8R9R8_9AGAM|nr:hypothetical protein FA95DRAFT_1565958 [Auriscalpium vulgare]
MNTSPLITEPPAPSQASIAEIVDAHRKIAEAHNSIAQQYMRLAAATDTDGPTSTAGTGQPVHAPPTPFPPGAPFRPQRGGDQSESSVSPFAPSSAIGASGFATVYAPPSGVGVTISVPPPATGLGPGGSQMPGGAQATSPASVSKFTWSVPKPTLEAENAKLWIGDIRPTGTQAGFPAPVSKFTWSNPKSTPEAENAKLWIDDIRTGDAQAGSRGGAASGAKCTCTANHILVPDNVKLLSDDMCARMDEINEEMKKEARRTRQWMQWIQETERVRLINCACSRSAFKLAPPSPYPKYHGDWSPDDGVPGWLNRVSYELSDDGFVGKKQTNLCIHEKHE